MKKQNKTTITKNTKRKGKKKKKEKRLFARNSAPPTCREIFLPLRHVGHEREDNILFKAFLLEFPPARPV